MSEKYVTPTTESVTSLLSMIFGDELSASGMENADVTGAQIATFVNDEDKLVATCVCDLEFVIYSGAALSMIPAASAKDMVAEQTVSEVVAGNFYEVMNICTKLLMSDTSAHLKLNQTLKYEPGSELFSALDSCSERLNFAVEIPGYGEGRIAISIA